MKKNSLFFIIFFVFAVNAAWASWAEVTVLKGKATFEGKKLKKGQIIKTSGNLSVGKKSFLKILLKKWGNTITLGPGGKMELNLADDTPPERKYRLTAGACRWIQKHKKEAAEKRQSLGVYTRQAALGVRGTDFIVKTNPGLGETEIVVLDGKVEFTNLLNSGDNAMVGKGQWGGVGGRFGKKIGDILDLPGDVLAGFSKMLKL